MHRSNWSSRAPAREATLVTLVLSDPGASPETLTLAARLASPADVRAAQARVDAQLADTEDSLRAINARLDAVAVEMEMSD